MIHRMKTVAPFLARAFVLAVALTALGGCGAWQTTKQYYKDYVNPDPAIDIAFEGLSSGEEKELARLFGPVDMRLESLLRDLDRVDSFPERADWFDKFRTKHAFLDGVTAVGVDGEIIKHSPEVSLKPLDFKPILSLASEAEKRLTISNISKTEFGPEIYLAQPFFKANKLLGFIVATFDPRSLAEASPEPGKLIMLSYDGLLYAADPASVDPALIKTPWRSFVRDQVQGSIRVDGKRYVWLARYLAGQHLVYVAEPPQEKKGFWFW